MITYEYSFEDHNEMNFMYIYGVFLFRGWWHICSSYFSRCGEDMRI